MCSNCDKKNERYLQETKERLEKYRPHLGNTVDGWVNVVKKSPAVEMVATVRIDICNKCEHKKNAGVEISGKVIGIDYCGICKCPIISKTRSMAERCPANKWGPHVTTI